MATTRTAFWLFLLSVLALDQVLGATLNLTASDSGAVDEGSGLTLSCVVNGEILSSEWVYFENSRDTSPTPSFSPVCYVVTAADECYTSGPWNQCYCRTKRNSTYREYDIYIRDVKVDHASNWRCRLYYDKNVSNYLSVDVNGRPTRPTLSPVSTSAGIGEDVTLTCSSQPTSMPADIRTALEFTWRKEGVVLSGETGSTLVMRNVQTSHEGRYTCQARESGKTLTSEESNAIHVDVQYAPSSVTLSPPTSAYDVRETTGSVPSIRCQADCDPPCLFRWTDKGGNPVGGIGSELQLTSLRRDQSGIFTCSASNHLGHSDVQVNMTAAYPPEVTLNQTEVRLEEGDNVTVLCHVDASPPAEVSWLKVTAQGQVTLQSSPQLELRGVGEGHAGLYTCSASNRLSPQPSQASLRVHVTMQLPERKPDAILSWKEGVGIAVGCFVLGLLVGLLCCLVATRRRQFEDMPPEPTTVSSCDDDNRRPSVTFQGFHWYQNQAFVVGKDLQDIEETPETPVIGNQKVKEANRQSQSNGMTKPAERDARKASVNGAAYCSTTPAERENRESRANECEEAKVQASNGLACSVAEAASGERVGVEKEGGKERGKEGGKEEGKEGGKEGVKEGGESQKRGAEKNGDVKSSPMSAELEHTTML